MGKQDKGPTAVEYALMIAGIAVVIIAVVLLLGSKPPGPLGGRPRGAERP